MQANGMQLVICALIVLALAGTIFYFVRGRSGRTPR